MADFYVQIDDDKGSVHHRVKSFDNLSTPTPDGSIKFERAYHLGCGATVTAGADRLSEAETEPGGPRHVAKGCFKAQAS